VAIDLKSIPHGEVINWKIEQINKDISIDSIKAIDGGASYIFDISYSDRKCSVKFSEEFLEDLPKLDDSPSSEYYKNMHAQLSELLIEPITTNGLVPYTKERLKIHIYDFMKNALESTKQIHKYNSIGRTYQSGGLESYLKVKFTNYERNQADIAWEELKRQGVIVPTYSDSVSPEDWVTLAETSLQKPLSINSLFLSSTCNDMIDLRAALISELQTSGINVEYSESPTFAGLSVEDTHDICLDKVAETEVFAMIIDSRYGSPYEGKRAGFDGLSIIHAELRTALHNKDKPIIVFIRDRVKHEFEFWKRNPGSNISAQETVFKMIDEIELIADRKVWVDDFRDVEDLKKKLIERLKSTK